MQAMTLKMKTQNRLLALVAGRRKRIDKQRNKLCLGAFDSSPAVFVKDVGIAVTQLELQTITLLPIETSRREARRSGVSGEI